MGTLIDSAFEKVDRTAFMLDQYRHLSGLDQPFPIGFGQTISQPTTVRMMLGWLEARRGQKVLDVGAGSGWTSALLAHIVGRRGRVTAVERIVQLVEFGRANCMRAGIDNVDFYRPRRGQLGWPLGAPYDRILVSAAASSLPAKLIDQLAPGGVMVVPVKSDIVVVRRAHRGNDTTMQVHPGFTFVPLVS